MKDKSQLQAGLESGERGQAAGAKTEREQAYIAAIAKLYSDFDSTPQHARLIAYRDAMGKVAANYSEDHEAQIFYATLAGRQHQKPCGRSACFRKLQSFVVYEAWCLFSNFGRCPPVRRADHGVRHSGRTANCC